MDFEDLYLNIPENVRKFLWIKNGDHKNFSKNFTKLQQGSMSLEIDGLDEPSLIDTRLSIRTNIPAEFKGSLDIYNSYEDLTPIQRGYYLDWLTNIRPDVDFQYPFIYFQGLERHLINATSVNEAAKVFDMMGFIVNSLNYREISSYLFNDALYSYKKLGTNRFLKEYVNQQDLGKRSQSLYNSIVNNYIPENDIESYIWENSFGLGPHETKNLKELFALRKHYVPVAVKFLYGTPFIPLPPDIKPTIAFGKFESPLKNADQYHMGNISFDLESERTLWVRPVESYPSVKAMAKEVLVLASKFIDAEFERRQKAGLKLRNTVLKHMYDPNN